MAVKKTNESSLPSSFNDDIQRQKYINKRQSKPDNNQAWWINGAFVIATHIATLISLFTYTASFNTIVMTFMICNLGMFG